MGFGAESFGFQVWDLKLKIYSVGVNLRLEL